MNWLQRNAQNVQINDVLKQVFENSGPYSDLTSATNFIANNNTDPSICETISQMAHAYYQADPSGAYEKARQLSEAAGCPPFNPMSEQQNIQMPLPQLGEQERTETPEVQIE